MSLVDDIFGSIPGPLISQFGSSATYIKANSSPTYNATTGTVSGAATEISVKIVFAQLKPEEMQGLYQLTDMKFIIAASDLSGYFPRTTDSIRYTQSGVSRTAKIVGILSPRGDNAIMHSIVARVG
jgi:hypothetical protein